MKELNLKLNEYKAKLIFYALNKEITNLENSQFIELEINKKELINLIELRNTIAVLIQNK
tara:strand:- start:38 stop:217 length:180 start_codon:yes stop_codon:yes gene_type:complete